MPETYTFIDRVCTVNINCNIIPHIHCDPDFNFPYILGHYVHLLVMSLVNTFLMQCKIWAWLLSRWAGVWVLTFELWLLSLTAEGADLGENNISKGESNISKGWLVCLVKRAGYDHICLLLWTVILRMSCEWWNSQRVLV